MRYVRQDRLRGVLVSNQGTKTLEKDYVRNHTHIETKKLRDRSNKATNFNYVHLVWLVNGGFMLNTVLDYY